jgi:hypothetical protein
MTVSKLGVSGLGPGLRSHGKNVEISYNIYHQIYTVM